MKSYRNLIVWQKLVKKVTLVYYLLKQFLLNEKFGLTSQIKSNSVFIPSYIAERYGRNYTKDSTRFLQVSRSTLFKVQTQLQIAVNLNFINKNA